MSKLGKKTRATTTTDKNCYIQRMMEYTGVFGSVKLTKLTNIIKRIYKERRMIYRNVNKMGKLLGCRILKGFPAITLIKTRHYKSKVIILAYPSNSSLKKKFYQNNVKRSHLLILQELRDPINSNEKL